MIYKTKPKDFNSQFECVACVLECDNEILLLHRQDYKNQGDTWGLPAGKVENKESIEQAVEREIIQETGYNTFDKLPKLFVTLPVNHSGRDFIYHMFHLGLDEKPLVKINTEEHKDYRWVKISKALEMNLIEDLKECLMMYYEPQD